MIAYTNFERHRLPESMVRLNLSSDSAQQQCVQTYAGKLVRSKLSAPTSIPPSLLGLIVSQFVIMHGQILISSTDIITQSQGTHILPHVKHNLNIPVCPKNRSRTILNQCFRPTFSGVIFIIEFPQQRPFTQIRRMRMCMILNIGGLVPSTCACSNAQKSNYHRVWRSQLI
jgi:hypothetical protein